MSFVKVAFPQSIHSGGAREIGTCIGIQGRKGQAHRRWCPCNISGPSPSTPSLALLGIGRLSNQRPFELCTNPTKLFISRGLLVQSMANTTSPWSQPRMVVMGRGMAIVTVVSPSPRPPRCHLDPHHRYDPRLWSPSTARCRDPPDQKDIHPSHDDTSWWLRSCSKSSTAAASGRCVCPLHATLRPPYQ